MYSASLSFVEVWANSSDISQRANEVSTSSSRSTCRVGKPETAEAREHFELRLKPSRQRAQMNENW